MALIRIFLFLLLSVPISVFAAPITINAGQAPYNTVEGAIGTSVRDDVMARTGAMSALVGMYRSIHGAFSVETGQVFIFIWQDGSKERGVANQPMSSVGTVPVPNTQSRPSGGGVGYTTYPNGNFYGGPNVIGFRMITQTVTVCVSGFCETFTNIIGYEWVYGPGGRPPSEAA